jgi:hypothetical protein
MTEALRQPRSDVEHRSMANIVSRVMAKLDPRSPRQRHSRRRHQTSPAAEPAHYVVEHSGWASVGWSEEDPTADEAMAALASLRKVDFPSAMEGLRKSGETSLKRLKEG